MQIKNEKHTGMSRHIDRKYNLTVLPAKVNTYTIDKLCPSQDGVSDYSLIIFVLTLRFVGLK